LALTPLRRGIHWPLSSNDDRLAPPVSDPGMSAMQIQQDSLAGVFQHPRRR
jgi:hypothetical protein